MSPKATAARLGELFGRRLFKRKYPSLAEGVDAGQHLP
jgi:hypothetical protein